MNVNLWDNLLFGVSKDDCDRDRVGQILRKLKMEKTLALVDANLRGRALASATYMDSSWQEQLTYTEKVKLHLARALIMNPEVLVLQRPLHHYEATTAKEVLATIRKHVNERGLCMPQGRQALRRRPRTCFFSPESVDQATEADVIWQIRDLGQQGQSVLVALASELVEGFEETASAARLTVAMARL